MARAVLAPHPQRHPGHGASRPHARSPAGGQGLHPEDGREPSRPDPGTHEDFELHGRRIPKGAELGLVFGSANRDPSVFERPDDLEITRDPNPHVTFGAGIHYCLGAPLGRLELETSFRTLLERAPHMELAREPEWKPNYILRGLREVIVRL